MEKEERNTQSRDLETSIYENRKIAEMLAHYYVCNLVITHTENFYVYFMQTRK